tara:strand:- start:28976 stop:29230 length:255 start_codon:yes stop_codon:yes gene_type:complete
MVTIKSGRKVTHFRFSFALTKGATKALNEADQDGAYGNMKSVGNSKAKKTVTSADIERYARPGESYEMARGRLENLMRNEDTLR